MINCTPRKHATVNILLKYQSDIAKASKELQGDGGAKKPGVPRTS
jgi:hypothetical protein